MFLEIFSPCLRLHHYYIWLHQILFVFLFVFLSSSTVGSELIKTSCLIFISLERGLTQKTWRKTSTQISSFSRLLSRILAHLGLKSVISIKKRYFCFLLLLFFFLFFGFFFFFFVCFFVVVFFFLFVCFLFLFFYCFCFLLLFFFSVFFLWQKRVIYLEKKLVAFWRVLWCLHGFQNPTTKVSFQIWKQIYPPYFPDLVPSDF